MTDHDHLHKELLSEFFPDFLDLFFPLLAADIDRTSIEFQPQEIFTDITAGDSYEADVVAKLQYRHQLAYFIIHLEHQTRFHQGFDRRMFNYFAQLHRIYQLPVYPIVLFSHRSPRMKGVQPIDGSIDRNYCVSFADWEVLRFQYRAIRLNHLPWQDYPNRNNPVASALMAKMKMKRVDRPQVKLACLQQMSRLQLNQAQKKLISGYVDTYLDLAPQENEVFLAGLDKIKGREKEEMMEIVTSWMREGIQQGLEQGKQQGLEQGKQQGLEQGKQQEAVSFVLLLTRHRFGELAPELERSIATLSVPQLESLGTAILDFSTKADLQRWLNQSGA